MTNRFIAGRSAAVVRPPPIDPAWGGWPESIGDREWWFTLKNM